jgi:ClpP class serine protease
MVGDIAVIPITGMIRTNVDVWSEYGYGTALPDIRSKLQHAVESPKVKGILLYADTPGGQAAGNEELSAEIYAARDKKPICTYSPFLMASAGYYLGSAAGNVLVGPTATIGSIGVIIVHSQWTDPAVKFEVVRYGANKALGNPYEPLGDKGRAELQKIADSMGQMFDMSVARNRGVSQETVASRSLRNRLT